MTYQKLLEDFARVTDAEYRSDPERSEAVADALLKTVRVVLEKLADQEVAEMRNWNLL